MVSAGKDTITSCSVLFNKGNGEGNATSYTTTKFCGALLVHFARGEITVSGSYGGCFDLNASNIGGGFYNERLYYNVQAGVTFTNPAFNPSITNGGLVVIELNY